MQNHSGSLTLQDLKLASFSGAVWDKELVASAGDIGTYNSHLILDEKVALVDGCRKGFGPQMLARVRGAAVCVRSTIS